MLKDNRLQAVVLAGGLGTRLRPYTFLLPKPMLPVGPKPIMEHLLEWLNKWGIEDVVVSTGYLGKMLQEYFGSGADWGMKIAYATSARPLGTAGQLKAAESKIKGRFVCVYGDQLLDFDLAKALEFHQKKKAAATMVLMKYSTELKYGFMETDRDGRLTEWKEKPTISGYINVGCYVMERSFLRFISPGRVYEMNDAFNEAKAAGARLYAIKVDGTFTDIGDRRSFKEANKLYTRNLGEGDDSGRS
ncbi:MAG: nucleotidyltransferase family protein [Nitrososphaerota archaeon]|nr:nucleotidyltransferase family protein [Nitrososphaerota archaeon]MDG6937098.1 nucleotidyltransferase family protein [Nitrososphaerota archaeon]MDG6972340.1 nucleotidyltransferase family protein [Nitrososphaerota archaeon]MDG6980076.1 nucleotidyltransferase family protein [Nitrososphaerota archaeon]MDG6986924.1 nucleotidyltransferase family protein [Nitrososphaerota archaeon]